MHTPEQLAQVVLNHTKDIAAIKESVKSAHKRIDDNDRIIASIHELAKNVAAMAAEIKLLTDRFDKNIERIEQGQKTQGERIGEIERAIHQIESNEKTIIRHAEKLEAMEKEPAQKWKDLGKQVLTLVIAAVVGMVIANIMR